MADLWFSHGCSVFTTNKTDRHDITEILLNVTFNAINTTPITKSAACSCKGETRGWL